MMEAMRRVISGENMHSSSPSDDDAIGMQIDDDEYTPSQGPALVESDTADFHIASASETPRSSLSDMSAAQRLQDAFLQDDDYDYDEDDKPIVTQTTKLINPRQQVIPQLHPKSVDLLSDESSSVGKAGSSQTSSRDWGWFEDVHASDGALTSKESPVSRSGKRSKDESFKKKRTATTMSSRVLLSRGIYHETLQPIVTRDPETGESRMKSLRVWPWFVL